MDTFVLPKQLEASQHVLIAGAGGGFDLYAGIPVYSRLRAMGKDVNLANLSFTNLQNTSAARLAPALYVVDRSTVGENSYFPERNLCRFLERRLRESMTVFAIENAGGRLVRQAYAELSSMLNLDAVVLVDGGTDILLRGDEAGLGTPVEDMLSLVGAYDLRLPTGVVFCVGFGVDSFHGVCHAHWLENVAALSRSSGFLGALALLPRMPEVQFYLDAVDEADLLTVKRPSLVNGSISSAIQGKFGDYHRSLRTQGSELFINPLMSLLWAFDLRQVAERNLYLNLIRETESYRQTEAIIEDFHASTSLRVRKAIPH